MGSVFSPYYHWALRNDSRTDPENHCCINVALYGKGARRWTMTERGKKSISRTSQTFQVGPSHLHWNGRCLEIDFDEWAVPLFSKARGKIRVYPERLFNFVAPLDANETHHWGPLAPSARIEVELDAPSLSWKGHAYLDSNQGKGPIIDSFHRWDWSRCVLADGSVAVLYDISEKSGREHLLALRFFPDGRIEPFEAPARQDLPMALWRIGRGIRSDQGTKPRVLRTLEDTPFYVRSVLQSDLFGESVTSMHESLDVRRLDRTSTRLMLPWKMPRIA